MRLTKLWILGVLSVLVVSCGTLEKNVKSDVSRVDFLRAGETLDYDAVCFDEETAKIILKEAYARPDN